MMLSVRKSNIPEYLQIGELYRTLVENNDDPKEELAFPQSVLKLDTSVRSVKDCDYLLGSVRFWGVEDFVSAELVSFVLSDLTSELFTVLKEHEPESKFVHWMYQIAAVSPSDRAGLAIRSGMVEMVKAVFDKHRSFPLNACEVAAEVGSVEVLKYLRDQGYTWDRKTSFAAAVHGHVDVLKYLREQHYQVNGTDFRAAVEGGHLACVEYLYSLRGSVLDESYTVVVNAPVQCDYDSFLRYYTACLCTLAVRNGHLHCLQFLHEHGAFWDEPTCTMAATYGHLDCLQYAHEHGCPWNYQTTRVAVLNGHLSCLRYAHEKGCSVPQSVTVDSSNPCIAFARQIGMRVVLI